MARRPGSTPPDGSSMSIGALSRATGIAVDTLRTWERRYGVPAPMRKPSGHRLYPEAAIEHLRRVAQLLNRGHRPAEILPLAPTKLAALLSLSEGRAELPAPSPAAMPAGDAAAAPGFDALADAMLAFDRERLVRELRSNWARLGPLRFLEECAAPFMARIGNGWAAGTTNIRHEHFASACLAEFLHEARGPFTERANGPVVAAATLEDDLHEGGLLMVSVLLAVRGCRVVYLGVNLPGDEIAQVARQHPLDAVALSISAVVPKARAARMLRALRAKLPRRVALWVGGAGAPGGIRGVDRFASLAQLDTRIAVRS